MLSEAEAEAIAQAVLDEIQPGGELEMTLEELATMGLAESVLWVVRALDLDPMLHSDPRVRHVAEKLASSLSLRVERKNWCPQFHSTLCVVGGEGDASGMLVVRQLAIVSLVMLIKHYAPNPARPVPREEQWKTNAVHVQVCRPWIYAICVAAQNSSLTTDPEARSVVIDSSFATTRHAFVKGYVAWAFELSSAGEYQSPVCMAEVAYRLTLSVWAKEGADAPPSLSPGMKVLRVKTLIPVRYRPAWDPAVAEAEGVRFAKRRDENADLFEDPDVGRILAVGAEVSILRQSTSLSSARMLMPFIRSGGEVPMPIPDVYAEYCRAAVASVPRLGTEAAGRRGHNMQDVLNAMLKTRDMVDDQQL